MTKTLEIKITASSLQANSLKLTVTNEGEAFDSESPLGIAFDVDKTILPPAWQDAVKTAANNSPPQAGVANLVTLDSGWSAWVQAAPPDG